MMDPKRLWAKSKRDNDPEMPSMFLPGHLEDVYHAAQRVLDASADDQLKALGLDPEKFRDRFRRIVLLAAAVHDLGKANDHFQGMIRRTAERKDRPQGLRHEWVTVLMLQQLRARLLPAVDGTEVDFAIVEWAVAGHHPAQDHASPPRTCPPGAGTVIPFLVGYRDFADCLAWLKRVFPLTGELTVAADAPQNLVGSANVFAELTTWAKGARQRWEELPKDDRLLVAAVKDCLIAADVAGSALPRELPDDVNRWDWITQSFQATPRPGEVQTVVDDRAKTFTDRNEDRELFQARVAGSAAPVSFIKAGCGSGKTQAAYMWAANHHATRRLFFCYPTTGTATEGFRDYLHEPSVRADLFHSRRDVDFDIILTTGPDAKDADKDAAVRVESLDTWATPIVACTVDTVLGIVQNNKRGLFAWPALAQSAFVFDEIHAYDDRLFGALLRFLRDLPGLPALLMTASLPTARQEALQETLRQFRNLDLTAIPGPAELEALPRYHRATAAGNDPLPLVKETLHGDGKVLWVCNTVGRVMDAAERAKDLDPLIYHSRFRYEDRVDRHDKVIKAFKAKTAALAICSQVAEMSLDLSADLLVTDLATVPALIQRLGRLNRRAKNKGEPTKPFIVVEPDTHLPYTPADLDAARAWLEKLEQLRKDGISQHQLSACWEQSAENPPDLVPSAWLDGGPTTTVADLREASPGITVILNTPDYPDYEALVRYDARMRSVWKKARAERRKPTPEEMKPQLGEQNRLGAVTLPMPPPPKSVKWREWEKYKGIPIAAPAAVVYDSKRGAEWRS
jgi:CRISPR-associated endonuclease/helicase Cas3